MKNTLMTREKNPIFQKFLKEGEHPTTYLTPDRRKEVYDFMRLKVNCAPSETGSFINQPAKRLEPATGTETKEKFDTQAQEG